MYLPVLVALLLGLAVRRLARVLPPVAGVRALVGAGVAAAVGWVWALGLLVWTAIGELPVMARVGGWSTAALRVDNPVAAPVAYLAGAVLLAVAVGFVVVATGRVQAVRATRVLARQVCGGAGGELVVLPGEAPEAFALPALGTGTGRIVVSAGMLRALDAQERRVLFAHERAHLAGRHHWWLLVAQLAAAANPLLARLPAAVGYLLERAADEAAAADVGDRRLAARAVARAGLALHHAPVAVAARAQGIALGYTSHAVVARVRALLGKPPPARRMLLVGMVLAIAVAAAGAVDAGFDVEHLFEHAMQVSGQHGAAPALPLVVPAQSAGS